MFCVSDSREGSGSLVSPVKPRRLSALCGATRPSPRGQMPRQDRVPHAPSRRACVLASGLGQAHFSHGARRGLSGTAGPWRPAHEAGAGSTRRRLAPWGHEAARGRCWEQSPRGEGVTPAGRVCVPLTETHSRADAEGGRGWGGSFLVRTKAQWWQRVGCPRASGSLTTGNVVTRKVRTLRKTPGRRAAAEGRREGSALPRWGGGRNGGLRGAGGGGGEGGCAPRGQV